MYSFQGKKLNRSFARRVGKTLSTAQKQLLSGCLPTFLIKQEYLYELSMQDKEIYLEIGFGMGEHFVHQVKSKPNALFIGVEVYLNGVANALKLAKESNITNFLLWDDDLDLILDDLPNNLLSGIYILFPDPWPKRSHNKKRIFNQERLELLQSKLKSNGFLIFASDIDDYFASAINLVQDNGNFIILEKELGVEYGYKNYPDNYVVTKYHKKAQESGRTARFLRAVLKQENCLPAL
jgi:release factor glutamine methyltransferase